MRSIKGYMALMCWLLAFSMSHGQDNILERRISIKIENRTVAEALEQLQNQTGGTITYRPSELPQGRRITRSYDQQTIKFIIRDIWGSTNLQFLSIGKNITIKVNSKSQITGKGTLQGKITNDKNEPLIGVTVQLSGTTLGDVTDDEGKFWIPGLSVGSHSIVISSLGFETSERLVEINGGRTTNLVTRLNTSIEELQEVIVQAKSATQLKMEQPIQVESINTQALQTKSISLPQVINQTAGVKVRQTGGVGGAT
ncbi:MAG: carboxypeptidase-like regulatory domain-containing protein, partial [Bacteroidota bacterium]